jgi:hypothetical protein
MTPSDVLASLRLVGAWQQISRLRAIESALHRLEPSRLEEPMDESSLGGKGLLTPSGLVTAWAKSHHVGREVNEAEMFKATCRSRPHVAVEDLKEAHKFYMYGSLKHVRT